MLKRYLTIAAVLALVFAATPIQAGKVNLTFDHFYDGPAMLQALQSLNKAYPAFTDLRSIGKSEEGRDIWLLTINNPARAGMAM